MKRILWSAGILLCAYVLWFAIYRVEWDWFSSNEETTSYVSGFEMLNGKLHLALYEQRMWDAVIWTVIETKGPPVPSWPAHNADIKTTWPIAS